MTTARENQVQADVTAALSPLGLVLEDLTVTPAGKRRLVRVLVDRDLSDLPEDDTTSVVPPLDLDRVTDATRAVSAALDESDAMGEQPYTLEVGSVGTDRPLTLPRHFRRNVGRLVQVRAREGGSVTGRVTAADAEAVTLEVPGAKGEPAAARRVRYAACERATVQVEMNRSRQDEGEDR